MKKTDAEAFAREILEVYDEEFTYDYPDELPWFIVEIVKEWSDE